MTLKLQVKIKRLQWSLHLKLATDGDETKLFKSEFKCCMIWQMTVTLLHSNGQLRTERDGDTEKGCQKPAVQ